MATTPWQPAPDTVASLWKRRPHGTVPGQFSINPQTGMGNGMAFAAVKTLHKVLSPPTCLNSYGYLCMSNFLVQEQPSVLIRCGYLGILLVQVDPT